MILHTASGRWKLGLALALLTAGLWATLPIALKLALEALDPWTLTWFRFLFALLLIGPALALRGRLACFSELRGGHWLLLWLAAIGLIGNYIAYLLGLDDTTPANAQLLIQLAPLLMALGGIVVFRERFAPGQWLGLMLLMAGMLLFFRDQLGQSGTPHYLRGSLMIVVAALSWAVYALAQKQLLLRLGSQQIMAFVYLVAALALLPMTAPASLLLLTPVQWAIVLYCALNTVLAYGAFAEALAHWEASRVSAVLALTPLLTVLGAEALALWLPGRLAPENIGLFGIAGALMVVLGSMLTALLRRPA